MEQGLIDEAAAAKYLGVSRRTIQWWRLVRRGPRYVKLGRLVRYRVEDLRSYVEDRVRPTASEGA